MRPASERCDQNYAAAFEALMPHVGSNLGERRAFGSVVAVATGIDLAFYNPVFATTDDAGTENVVAAVTWMRSLGLPASVQLAEGLRARLEPALLGLGLRSDRWVTPGMALQPIPARSRRPEGLAIERVVGEKFDDWHEGIAYGPRFRQIWGPALLDDPAFAFVVGYVEGQPVSGAAAFVHDSVVGVYAVGTVEHARRRGFGQAVTWAAIHAGADAGCDVAVLQATDVAVSVYERMGFVEVRRYVEYM